MRPALTLWLIAAVGSPALAGAEPVDSQVTVPAAAPLPSLLSLDEAVRLCRSRGLDVLLADAAVLVAGGDLEAAAAVKNPSVSIGGGPTFNYVSTNPGCVGCQDFGLAWSLGDSGAVLDLITAKRMLRVRGAREALLAAQLGRADAERVVVGLVKHAYVRAAVALGTVEFDVELARALADTLALNRKRLDEGAINGGDLARIAVQKLEAEQAVAAARQAQRTARVALAFLLGVRGAVPDFEVDRGLLAYRPSPALAALSEEGLIARALAVRPDLRAQRHLAAQAAAQLSLARRQRFPDVQLGLSWSQFGAGAGAASPQAVAVSSSLNLPVFYQQQGEVRRAEAARGSQSLGAARAVAQVVSDVGSNLAAARAAQRQVERLQTVELAQARLARDIVATQYQRGAARLTDYLDAQRAFIGANLEFITDLGSYLTAGFALEQAVGEELAL